MIITHIRITNFRGLTPVDQDLPAICLVQGKNELGKTAFLEAILYLWEDGHDDANITTGADKAEIIATMDDGMQVRAVLTRNEGSDKGGTSRMSKKPGAKQWKVGRAEIDALVNGIGYNPLEFMRMKPKEQLALLLKVMPVTVGADEIIKALSPLDKSIVVKLDAASKSVTDALSKIAAIRTVIYDERTGVNRSADTQKKHGEELEASLGPATEEKDWGVEVARLEAEGSVAEEKKADAKDTVRATLEEKKAHADKLYETAMEAARQARDALIDAGRKNANEEWAKIEPGLDAAISAVNADLATARERDRLSSSHAATRKAAEVAKQSAMQMVKQSKALTEALENLDKLQSTIADRLPIPGIRFINGEVHNEEGIPFRNWNTATQTFFCLKLGVLMGSGFIILDRGLEVLDPDNQKAFLDRAQKLANEKKMQFFVASITNSPELSIGEVV